MLPPEGTGSRAAISHAIRRHALEEGAITSVAAQSLAQVMTDGSRVCIFARTVFAETRALADLEDLPVDLGSVQISVLRLAGSPMSLPAERFLRHIEAQMDMVGP